MDIFVESLGVFLLVMVVVVIVSAVFALPVMWLWNCCLVYAVNGVNHIDYTSAWGISLLSSMLFKSYSYNK